MADNAGGSEPCVKGTCQVCNLVKTTNTLQQKRFHSHYVQDCHKDIDDWEVTLFEKCEAHNQLKENEMSWQHK